MPGAGTGIASHPVSGFSAAGRAIVPYMPGTVHQQQHTRARRLSMGVAHAITG